MPREVNVLAMIKGAERYVFLYDDESRADLLQTFGRYAENPELSFNWYDAALLSRKVRRRVSPNKARPSRRNKTGGQA